MSSYSSPSLNSHLTLNPHLTQANPLFLPTFLPNYRPLRLPLLLFWVQVLLLVVKVGVNWTIIAVMIPLVGSDVSVWQSRVDADMSRAEQTEEGTRKGDRWDEGGRTQIEGINGSGGLASTPAAGGKDVVKSNTTSNTDSRPSHLPDSERFACIGSDPTDVWGPRLVGLALWAISLGLLGPQVCASWGPLVRLMWERYVLPGLGALSMKMMVVGRDV